jgi:GT2 family glycosyltransferase
MLRHEAHLKQRSSQRKRRPFVSVCIVNWNCRRYLRDCLRSLRSSLQRVRLEVIVVDNASTDGAAEMVERCFPRVRLIRNVENRGFARGNNQAARVARGRYLFFLNNDTVVPPGALHELLDFARSHPEAGLIGPCLRDGNGRMQAACRGLPTVPALLHRTSLLRWTGLFRAAYRVARGRHLDLTTTHPAPVLMGAAMLMPRAAYDQCGGWDEGYTFGGEDVELCARVGRHYQVIYHPDVTITHYGRVSSRLHIDFAHRHHLIGMTRFLRSAGATSLALRCYKTVLTLDAPLQWLSCGCQFVWRRLRGRREEARRSWVALRGVTAFILRGLPALWRA